MRDENMPLEEERVRFLGRVIASISHELKNALATVHETAGLLGDIVAAPGGASEEAEEVGSCARGIEEELERAFGIIRNLNRFAHSADEPRQEIAPVEVVDLVAALASYASYAGRARVDEGSDPAARLTTNLLLFEDLVYRLLLAGYRARGRDAEISVAVRPAAEGIELTFTGLGPEPLQDLRAGEAAPVLRALGGRVLSGAGEEPLRVRLVHRREVEEAP